MAESVSAANEVKLTEAEVLAVVKAALFVDEELDALSETDAMRCCSCVACNHYRPDYEPGALCEVDAIWAGAIKRLVADRPQAVADLRGFLGARLSAREPDNEVTHPCGVCGTPLNAEQDAFHDCVADSEEEQAAKEYSKLLGLLVGVDGDPQNTRVMNQARAVLAAGYRQTAVPVSGVPTEAVRELADEFREQKDRAAKWARETSENFREAMSRKVAWEEAEKRTRLLADTWDAEPKTGDAPPARRCARCGISDAGARGVLCDPPLPGRHSFPAPALVQRAAETNEGSA